MSERNRFDIEVGDTTPIADDEIDFKEIQEMLSRRPNYLREETILAYEPLEPRNEPKYENMHVKNLTISEKTVQKIAKILGMAIKKGAKIQEQLDNNTKLKVVVASAVITGVLFGTWIGNRENKKAEIPFYDTTTSTGTKEETKEETKDNAIRPMELDFSNLSIILKTSTPNAIHVTSTVSRELTNFGIHNQRVTTEEGMVSAVEFIKAQNPNTEIIVVNVGDYTDTKDKDVIVITNAGNSDVRSADNLAIAIRDNNEQRYGISTFIECGETNTNGGHVETTEQATLIKAGHNDVLCCNVKTSSNIIADEILANSIATSIAEGIVRLGATETEHRYADSIIISDAEDEIVPVAETNGMTHTAFIKSNMDIIHKGVIIPNEAMVVTTLPYTMNVKETTVSNNLTTTNSNIDYYTEYYTVRAGQTVTEIAEDVGVSIDDIYVPSGDKNKIRVGEKVGYTVPEKIVVTENLSTKGQK